MGFTKHNGSLSSNGIKTTPSANYEIDFGYSVNSLELINEGTTNMTIKLNNESNYHLIKTGEIFKSDDFRIGKITIIEQGAMYSYSAFYY